MVVTKTVEFWSVSDLKRRGWVASLIAAKLGCSDHTEPNPHHQNGYPAKYYLSSRVLAYEATQEWADLQVKLSQRRAKLAAARAAADVRQSYNDDLLESDIVDYSVSLHYKD